MKGAVCHALLGCMHRHPLHLSYVSSDIQARCGVFKHMMTLRKAQSKGRHVCWLARVRASALGHKRQHLGNIAP